MPVPEAREPSQSTRSPAPSQRSPEFEYALDLALQGFAVFPLRPGTKAPLGKYWEQAASTDPRRIARWWTTNPHANIAIACGPSNLLVIDLDAAKQPDGPRHGQDVLATLANGRELPRTFTVTSARGGRHLYYRQPDGLTLRNTAGSKTAGLGPLIDTRGHGGYIVAPGSTFAGGTYRIEQDAAVATLPAWIIAELESHQAPTAPTTGAASPAIPVPERRRAAYATSAFRTAANTVTAAPEGTRNHTLNREAFRLGRLVGGGILDHDDAASTLRRAAIKVGLEPREIENTITSGLAAGTRQPRSISNRKPQPENNPNAPEAPVSTTPTNTSPSASPVKQEAAASQEVELTTNSEEAFDFESIWTDVQAKIKSAREALPDVPVLTSFDDVNRAVAELRTTLAQAPISLRDPADTPLNATTTTPIEATDLDAHLAGVDTVYAEAKATGISTTTPEWAGISAIHAAAHNLWDTIKAASGSYWTELAADARVRGLLTTLATRATLTIATLANAAADRLEQRASQQLDAAPTAPTLREAYLDARKHVRANAASHEWQRITALWGTINTLTRQTDDPNIRAVVARSAETLAGFAESLSRRASHFDGQDNLISSTNALAQAAQRHAANLRGTDLEPGQLHYTATVLSKQSPDAQTLQEQARRVAQHAQARLGQESAKTATTPRRHHSSVSETNQNAAMRLMQPTSSPAPPRVQMK